MEFDRRYRDENTGEIYYGQGFWGLVSKLTSKTAKKLASTAAEKLITKVLRK